MKKFYKIFNEKECHNGLQYKTGLNVDPVEFNPKGSCEPGGIYYAQKDILAFLRYGPWIREVTIPEDAQVYKDPARVTEKWKADKVVLGERRKITAGVIKELIKEGADVHAQYDNALRRAAENGYTEIVASLIEHDADVHAQDDYALRRAAINGHTEIVKLLLEHGAYVHAIDDEALRWASHNGHTEIVKLLLENGADIHALDDCALHWASENGHTETVKLLLEHGGNVHAKNDKVLRCAAINGHTETVKLLEEWIEKENA